MKRSFSISNRTTPFQGPEFGLLCGNPVSNNEGTVESISSWPQCEQLPCVCLGKDNGLDATQSARVLQTACASEGTYEKYQVRIT